MTPARRCPYDLGDEIVGITYVPPKDRRRETPQPFTGRVVQVGSGWDGVEADQAYLWARLDNGLEVKALIGDCERKPR
ncbi:hypothetical protein [Streptomyces sp. NRRL S-87]|uniref:hypothetical protein n=1 Tax=Streptomyces sp. NRRL S-87 TaxID=1463920 RepID=UPI0004BE6E12|nr:hypothetical protein [Streptomyces sp. NRRL S-87]